MEDHDYDREQGLSRPSGARAIDYVLSDSRASDAGEPYAYAEVVESDGGPSPPPPQRRKWLVPLLLYLASFVTTFGVYYLTSINQGFSQAQLGAAMTHALIYSGGIMFILTAHELGHFLQAIRYRVPASFPYFIPMPLPPIGTMGAVIVMRGHMGHRRALFDIGISGPLAGLVPALIFTIVGIHWSEVRPITHLDGTLGEPLLFTWLIHWVKGPLPAGYDVFLHPLGFAGWVGFLITSLNLFPIGQLDGGHILYAMLRRKSYPVAIGLLVGIVGAMIYMGAYQWLLMVLLLARMGPLHPPTANDEEPLGVGRAVLGALTLMFVIVGFTPAPFGSL